MPNFLSKHTLYLRGERAICTENASTERPCSNPHALALARAVARAIYSRVVQCAQLFER